MHVYGLGSLDTIFKSFIHPVFTSVYTVLKKVRMGVRHYTVFIGSEIRKSASILSWHPSSISQSNYS